MEFDLGMLSSFLRQSLRFFLRKIRQCAGQLHTVFTRHGIAPEDGASFSFSAASQLEQNGNK